MGHARKINALPVKAEAKTWCGAVSRYVPCGSETVRQGARLLSATDRMYVDMWTFTAVPRSILAAPH